MRNLDRSMVLGTLCLAAVATASVAACSVTNVDATGEDGGIGPLPDGALPDSSEPDKPCATNADCSSGVCNLSTHLCTAASCKDGTKNASETDVDCGGDCPKCDQAKSCKVGADCATGVCKDAGTGLKCQAPSITDGVQNGRETGIDCGGTGNPKCPDGQGCKLRDDCTSDYCKAGKCTAIVPADGVKNGTETDVDCGGEGNARCDDALSCLLDADCKSDVCKNPDGLGLKCQVPSPTDGKKNGAETDVDCGGGGANPGCAAGLTCLAGGDCASLGCDYNKKCAIARSCTTHYGGDTCGLGGAGGVGAEAWESCCTTAAVNTVAGGTVYMDKYPATAGRVRVFLESIGYDVRAFVQQARADGKIPVIPTNVNGVVDNVHPVLDPAWDLYLPTSFLGNNDPPPMEIADGDQGDPTTPQNGIYTAIKRHLGGTIFKNNAQTSTGCFVGSPGTHSFRFPDDQQDGATPEQPVEVYDTKTLQCVDYLVAQAFCVWDGGRLETLQEWQQAYGAGATPWSAVDARTPHVVGSASYYGCRFPFATDADQSQCGAKFDATLQTIEFADYQYSYEYPMKTSVDYIVHLTAPGRTRGRGPLGHSDVIGAGFELTSSVTWNPDVFTARHRWSGNGSWEVHNYSKAGGGSTMLLNKYGKLGLRCVKFAP